MTGTYEAAPGDQKPVPRTLSPMSSVNSWLAATASSTVRRRSVRVAGLSVVDHSCSGIISPRPCMRNALPFDTTLMKPSALQFGPALP